jgi:SAM-dependent methyltransferase
MENNSHSSVHLELLKRAHGQAVFSRRVRVLAELLAARVPAGAALLDIGCGDGTIASAIKTHNPTISVQGVEFAPRPSCAIECLAFNGAEIPHASASFDVCMFVDVLHHTKDEQGLATLLSEACRVSRKYLLIKDHLSETWLDFKVLQFMDWVGNRPHGVVLPYHYQTRQQWQGHFSQAGLKIGHWDDHIPLYPFPFSAVFGRRLHFIALLEKT